MIRSDRPLAWLNIYCRQCNDLATDDRPLVVEILCALEPEPFDRLQAARPQIVVARAAIGVAVATGRFFALFQRPLARIELGLALPKLLLVFRLMLGGKTLLHLTLDLGVSFRIALLFLAAAGKQSNGDEQRKQANPFHKMMGPNWPRVIRSDNSIRSDRQFVSLG